MGEEKNREIEVRIRDLWAVFLHCWWIMLGVGVIVTLGLYLLLGATHKNEYTATTTVYVLRENANFGNTTDISIANVLVNDYMYLATSDEALQSTIEEAGVSDVMSVGKLRRNVNVIHQEGTRFIRLSVTAEDPEMAAVLANMLAEIVGEKHNQLLGEDNFSRVSSAAHIPERPSNPISLLRILLVAFVCAVIVYGIYLILFLLDDKINTPEDVERYLGLNLLGQIPNGDESAARIRGYVSGATRR